MIDLRLLGALEVHGDGPRAGRRTLTQPKRVALLIYLALATPSGLHSRDELVALLWPEADEESARHSLRNGLHELRRTFGDDAVVTRGESLVGLNFGQLRCDAIELRACLAEGRVSEAIALWQGEIAPGFHLSGAPRFERWLDDMRATMLRSLRAAAWDRVRAESGAPASEAGALRAALRLDPGNEPGTRRLMQLLAEAGDRSGALEAYRVLTDYLAHELEVAPSENTIALAERLRSPATIARPRIERSAETSATRESPPVAAPADLPHTARRRRWQRPLAGVATIGALTILALFALWGGSSHRRDAMQRSSQADAERAVLRLPARYRADSAAYRSYLRGLQLRFDFHFIASRDTLAALVDREPLYVPGLYGLAHAWIFTTLNGLTDRDEAWPKVDALARRALALDSTSASAWLVLASEDMYVNGDLARARERIAHAQALDSLDPDAPGMLSVWFTFNGWMDSAVVEARVAHRLDPLSPLFARLVGKHLYFARRYRESLAVFDQMLVDDPGWTRGYADMSELYRVMNRPRDAVTWLRRAREAAGDSAGSALLPDPGSDSAALRLLVADARRSIAIADRAVRQGKRVASSTYARAYALLGDTTATLRWLDSMAVRHDSYLHQVRLDPRFDFVRSDPRYVAWARSTLPRLHESRCTKGPGGCRGPSR